MTSPSRRGSVRQGTVPNPHTSRPAEHNVGQGGARDGRRSSQDARSGPSVLEGAQKFGTTVRGPASGTPPADTRSPADGVRQLSVRERVRQIETRQADTDSADRRAARPVGASQGANPRQPVPPTATPLDRFQEIAANNTARLVSLFSADGLVDTSLQSRLHGSLQSMINEAARRQNNEQGTEPDPEAKNLRERIREVVLMLKRGTEERPGTSDDEMNDYDLEREAALELQRLIDQRRRELAEEPRQPSDGELIRDPEAGNPEEQMANALEEISDEITRLMGEEYAEEEEEPNSGQPRKDIDPLGHPHIEEDRQREGDVEREKKRTQQEIRRQSTFSSYLNQTGSSTPPPPPPILIPIGQELNLNIPFAPTLVGQETDTLRSTLADYQNAAETESLLSAVQQSILANRNITQITVRGYVNPNGKPDIESQISRARAEKVASDLQNLLPGVRVVYQGMGGVDVTGISPGDSRRQRTGYLGKNAGQPNMRVTIKAE